MRTASIKDNIKLEMLILPAVPVLIRSFLKKHVTVKPGNISDEILVLNTLEVTMALKKASYGRFSHL